MFEQTITSNMLLLVEELAQISSISSSFYMAGGTALAIQIGHKKSLDIDLFTKQKFNEEKLSQIIISLGGTVSIVENSRIHGSIKEEKLTLLHYPYPLLNDCVIFHSFNLAGIEDIACMKAVAISQRGEKKDFFDMFEILKLISPLRLRQLFLEKYTSARINCYQILKFFYYFDDAELQPDPIVLNNTSWPEVKNFFIAKEKEIMRDFLS